MQAGVYEHKRHPGDYYLLLGLARLHQGIYIDPEAGHETDEFVAYIPLRVQPDWSGTARIALRTILDFETNFEFVGDRLP